MSSTKRGKNRSEWDYYQTPTSPIVKFLNKLKEDRPEIYKALQGDVLDPAAGGTVLPDGTIKYPMAFPEAFAQAGITPRLFDTVDIRKDSLALYNGLNYLEHPFLEYDAIITNPPFDVIREYIEKALSELPHNGYLIFLLRLNLLGSDKRLDLWKQYMPRYIYVDSHRMSFTPWRKGKGQSRVDSIEYAYFIWQKDQYPYYAQIRVI